MNNNHISNKHLNHSEKNKIHSNTDFGKHLFSEKDISFKTFFHVSEAQNFLQAFATSTGIPSFILTQEGDVFKASGDIDKKNNNNSDVLDAFINFIHSQADSKNLPTETGIKIIENDSLYYSYSCFNILGKCVAAWYLGPVKSPQLTLEQFSNLQHFSQPSNKYEQMWGEIPVISTDKFKIIANSLDQMVQRLTQRAYLTILQEKTNNELSKSEKKFSHIFQNSPDAIAICRPKDLTILEINKGFEKLSGYSSDELIGKSLHGLLCSENECTKIFKNYEKAGELHNFELNCSLNNTDTRTLLISMTEVVFENENCAMIIYHDITERKRYLQEIEERDKLRDIISTISTQFIKLPVESIDNMIESSLGHIAKFAKTDFGFLALFNDSNDQFTLQLYKYDSKNNLNRENLNFSPQNLPWVMDQIFNKNNIKFNSVEDISSLPDKKYLSKLNIGAMSGIALLDQKKILGVAGFISKEKNHNWSNNDELLLQLACQIFSNALAKKTNSQKLQDSEKKYHSILQHLAEIVCVIDLDLNILFVSPSCENILGYSENDLIGKNFTELVNREKRNSIIKEIKKTSNGANSSSPVVFSLQHKKGHWIEVETLCDDKLNEPEINGIILTMRDITTQKQSEEKYKKSEEKFQQHFANVQDVIYTFNRKLQITSVSPSVEKILDYKPKELIGKPFTKMDLLSKQSLFKALTDLRAIFSGQGDVLSEIHFKAKDGSIKIGEVKASPVIEDGTITGIIGVARDITDRKKIENELYESEKRYKALVENAIVPIVVVTKNVISYLNHTAVELLGTKNAEQAVNQKFEKFIHPDYEKLFTAKFDKSFQLNKKPKNLLLKIIKPDKKIIDVQINAIAVTINNIKSQLLILNDITLQKQAEELLLAQHEFMAGLTRIHGLNDTLDYCLNQSINNRTNG